MGLISIAHAGIITEAPKVSTVLGNALNFLLSVFAVIAIIGLAISGTLYLISGGNEAQIEKAKKMMVYSVVGIIIALGSMVVVNQIIRMFA